MTSITPQIPPEPKTFVLAQCRQWNENTPAHLTDLHQTATQSLRTRKYHQTRWNRLRKFTPPNLLVILLKHTVLALGAFGGMIVSLLILLPDSFELRYLVAGTTAGFMSLMPLLLKACTGFLFTKSWAYRHCLTPIVFLTCAFSTLPSFYLLKKGASSELVAAIAATQTDPVPEQTDRPSPTATEQLENLRLARNSLTEESL